EHRDHHAPRGRRPRPAARPPSVGPGAGPGLGGRRGARRRGVDDPRALARRGGLGAVDALRRAGLLRHRLPLLRPVHRLPGAARRRHPGHPGRAPRERRRLRGHRPAGALRPPLRRHRRRRPAGRPGARGADGLPARHDLDRRRRDLRRCRAGHGGAVLLDAPQRQEPRADGARGDRRGRRGRGAHRRVRHHDHHPGGAGADRRQRPRRVAVGRVLHRADHPDRAVHGRVPARDPPGPGAGGHGHRRRPAPAGHRRRRADRRQPAGRDAHPEPRDPRGRPGRLRLHRLGAAGVGAADPARLPLDVHEDRRHRPARAGAAHRPPGAGQPGRHRLRPRGERPGVRRVPVPLRLHHHRLRRPLGLPRAHRLRHHAEDDRQGEPGAADRLRRDAHGELRRDQRPHRRLGDRPGAVLRHQLPGRGHRRHPRVGGGVRPGPRVPDRGGADRQRRPGDRGGVARLPHRRRADPGAGHQPDLQQRLRRRPAGVLVPLRDHVRGAVHPHRRRRRHPRRAVHAAGHDRQRVEALRRPLLAPGQLPGERGRGGGVGVLPLRRGHRPARRDQPAVPAVRHRQPAARGDRADPVRHADGQARQGQVGVGAGHPAGVGPDRDHDGELPEDLLRQPGAGVLRAARPLRRRPRGRRGAAPGDGRRPDAADRHQLHDQRGAADGLRAAGHRRGGQRRRRGGQGTAH
ncbi:MAG: Carbon starvation protein A, partial [uncultured Quadrisphaera sp.]